MNQAGVITNPVDKTLIFDKEYGKSYKGIETIFEW